MVEEYSVGVHVIFFDEFGAPKDALVTKWWQHRSHNESQIPECNLVTTHRDLDECDSSGRKIVRHESIPHKSKQPAPGMYWKWPHER